MPTTLTRLSLLLAALVCLLARPAQAQTSGQLYVTNGQVNAILRDGNTVYIGGNFSYVGPSIPYGSPVDAGTGAPNLAYARPNSNVNVAVPDGAGGWYIGGAFTQVGGVARNYLAQLDANGAVTAFNPNASSPVRALLLAGSTLYAGGAFTSIGGQSRSYLAALNTADGTALASFNPNPSTSVSALALAGSTLYVGGGASPAWVGKRAMPWRR